MWITTSVQFSRGRKYWGFLLVIWGWPYTVVDLNLRTFLFHDAHRVILLLWKIPIREKIKTVTN